MLFYLSLLYSVSYNFMHYHSPAQNGGSNNQRSTDFHINPAEVIGKPKVKKSVTIQGVGESTDTGTIRDPDMYLVVDGAVGGAQSVTVGQPYDPDYIAYKNKGKSRSKRSVAPDESQFSEFASQYFQNKVSSTYSKTMLDDSLLTTKNLNDKLVGFRLII